MMSRSRFVALVQKRPAFLDVTGHATDATVREVPMGIKLGDSVRELAAASTTITPIRRARRRSVAGAIRSLGRPTQKMFREWPSPRSHT